MTDEIDKFRRPNLFCNTGQKHSKFDYLTFTNLQFLEKLIRLVNFDYFS